MYSAASQQAGACEKYLHGVVNCFEALCCTLNPCLEPSPSPLCTDLALFCSWSLSLTSHLKWFSVAHDFLRPLSEHGDFGARYLHGIVTLQLTPSMPLLAL